MMAKIVVHRKWQNGEGTISTFSVDGGAVSGYILERTSMMIPAGSYRLESYNGTQWHHVFEVKGVPGRTAILIHSGNTPQDSTGCLLVGTNKESIGIYRSRDKLNELRRYLKGKDATITIEDH